MQITIVRIAVATEHHVEPERVVDAVANVLDNHFLGIGAGYCHAGGFLERSATAPDPVLYGLVGRARHEAWRAAAWNAIERGRPSPISYEESERARRVRLGEETNDNKVTPTQEPTTNRGENP